MCSPNLLYILKLLLLTSPRAVSFTNNICSLPCPNRNTLLVQAVRLRFLDICVGDVNLLIESLVVKSTNMFSMASKTCFAKEVNQGFNIL